MLSEWQGHEHVGRCRSAMPGGVGFVFHTHTAVRTRIKFEMNCCVSEIWDAGYFFKAARKHLSLCMHSTRKRRRRNRYDSRYELQCKPGYHSAVCEERPG